LLKTNADVIVTFLPEDKKQDSRGRQEIKPGRREDNKIIR
jgi:hypothetical protein